MRDFVVRGTGLIIGAAGGSLCGLTIFVYSFSEVGGERPAQTQLRCGMVTLIDTTMFYSFKSETQPYDKPIFLYEPVP